MSLLAGARVAPSVAAFRVGVARVAWRISPHLVGWAALASLYMVVGAFIIAATGSVPIDTWARVGNASYALVSRDPHLSAIGFVLSPLPTLAIMPLVPLKGLFPALVTEAFAANITSALFMAAAAMTLRSLLADLGVPRLGRWLLVGAFALHPLIVYYGANGLTEASLVWSLLLVVRGLLRWSTSGRLADLVGVGLGLAIAYLARYEAAAAAIAVAGVVFAISLRRSGALRRRDAIQAAEDTAIAIAPFALVFVAWAGASWLIVGSPFPHFTSVYGNSSQVELMRPYLAEQTGQGSAAALGYLGAQLLGLAPAILPLALVAIAVGAWRRDRRLPAVAAVLGAVVAFSSVTFLIGSTVGFLRYHIVIVPLMVLLAGFVIGSLPTRGRRAIGSLALSVPILAAVGLSLVTGYHTLRDPLLAREESDGLRTLIGTSAPATGSYTTETHRRAALIAADIDALDLPRGSVVIDVALGNPIVLQSRRPDVFVITPDRDFESIVSDPLAFDVHYLLVSQNSGGGRLDALNRTYPTLYSNGGGFADLVSEYVGGAAGGWRLYRLDG